MHRQIHGHPRNSQAGRGRRADQNFRDFANKTLLSLSPLGTVSIESAAFQLNSLIAIT